MNSSIKHLHTYSSPSLGLVARQSELKVRLLELGGRPIDEEEVDELQQVLHVRELLNCISCQECVVTQKEKSLPSELHLFLLGSDSTTKIIQLLLGTF